MKPGGVDVLGFIERPLGLGRIRAGGCEFPAAVRPAALFHRDVGRCVERRLELRLEDLEFDGLRLGRCFRRRLGRSLGRRFRSGLLRLGLLQKNRERPLGNRRRLDFLVAQHGVGHLVRFVLGVLAWLAILDLHLRRGTHAALLHGVRQLVSEETVAVCRSRPKLAGGEVDVAPDGERARVELPGCLLRGLAGVHPHAVDRLTGDARELFAQRLGHALRRRGRRVRRKDRDFRQRVVAEGRLAAIVPRQLLPCRLSRRRVRRPGGVPFVRHPSFGSHSVERVRLWSFPHPRSSRTELVGGE